MHTNKTPWGFGECDREMAGENKNGNPNKASCLCNAFDEQPVAARDSQTEQLETARQRHGQPETYHICSQRQPDRAARDSQIDTCTARDSQTETWAARDSRRQPETARDSPRPGSGSSTVTCTCT